MEKYGVINFRACRKSFADEESVIPNQCAEIVCAVLQHVDVNHPAFWQRENFRVQRRLQRDSQFRKSRGWPTVLLRERALRIVDLVGYFAEPPTAGCDRYGGLRRRIRKHDRAPHFGAVHVDYSLRRPDPIVLGTTFNLMVLSVFDFGVPLHTREVDAPIA